MSCVDPNHLFERQPGTESGSDAPLSMSVTRRIRYVSLSMTGSPFLLFQKFQHAAHQRGVLRIQPGGECLRIPLAGPDAVDGVGQPPAVLLQVGQYRLDLGA